MIGGRVGIGDLALRAAKDFARNRRTPDLARLIVLIITLLLIYSPDDILDVRSVDKTVPYFGDSEPRHVEQRIRPDPVTEWKPTRPLFREVRSDLSDWSVRGWKDGSRTQDQAIPPKVPTVAPEPSSWILMTLGLGFVGAGLRRRRAIASD